MRHKLFLVHGMGVYNGDTWAKEVKKVLVTAYKKYPKLAAIPFDSQFEIEMVHYDPIFQEIVSRWQADAKEIQPLAIDVGASQAAQLVGWLRTVGKKDGKLIWTHAADVLLYRLSATVRERVKVNVAKQIVEGISKQYKKEQQSLWSVIGHSLGTAVAHDALDMLATGVVPGTDISAFDPTIEQAQSITMIANTSRVLETKVVDVYQSAVQPGKAGQAGRDCLRYVNIRHFLDPFTIPRMFRPQSWPDDATVAARRYQYCEVTHVHQVNVHDVCHYLLNPQAHIPLLRALAGESMITKSQEKTAIDEFPQFNGLSPEDAARIKKDLAAISPSSGESWPSLKNLWDDFNALLEMAGEA